MEINTNDTEAKQPASAGCHPTTCCASSDTPDSDARARVLCARLDEERAIRIKLECALRKFMTVTETSDDGITQMATIEGRVKFYERLRTVRAEAHGILSHNAKTEGPPTQDPNETNQ